MSARKRTNSSKHSSPPISQSSSSTADNLPKPRETKSMRKVSPPFAKTSFHRIIYALAVLCLLMGGYYTWRIWQWKVNAGGWVNLALGRKPPQNSQAAKFAGSSTSRNYHSQNPQEKHTDTTVEDRLNALAEALGMPPKELASAIAGAVREYVPPASLSSVAAKETGEAVQELIKEASGEKKEKDSATPPEPTPESAFASVVGGFVGMDEP